MLILLAGSGRAVSLALLADWRKGGLLPAFASQGRGRGRSYFWREADIISHAQAAFDFLQTGMGRDGVLLGLFLAGFASPLPQVRRAWQHRDRMRASARALRFKDRDGGEGHSHPATAPIALSKASNWFLDGIQEIGENLSNGDRATMAAAKVFDCAMTRLLASYGQARAKSKRSAWAQIQIVALSLEGSDLVKSARDDQLCRAQACLGALAPLLLECSQGLVPAATRGSLSLPLWLAHILGPSIFSFVLLQIRMGHGDLLERFLENGGRPDRRTSFPPILAEPHPIRA